MRPVEPSLEQPSMQRAAYSSRGSPSGVRFMHEGHGIIPRSGQEALCGYLMANGNQLLKSFFGHGPLQTSVQPAMSCNPSACIWPCLWAISQ